MTPSSASASSCPLDEHSYLQSLLAEWLDSASGVRVKFTTIVQRTTAPSQHAHVSYNRMHGTTLSCAMWRNMSLCQMSESLGRSKNYPFMPFGSHQATSIESTKETPFKRWRELDVPAYCCTSPVGFGNLLPLARHSLYYCAGVSGPGGKRTGIRTGIKNR